MSCSNAFPPPAAAVSTEMGGPVERAADGFAASVWATSLSPTSLPPHRRSKSYANLLWVQRPEEWMRERAAQLKGQVRAMFEDGEGAVVDAVALVDTIERLGMDNHFRDEIAAALERIHQEEKGFASSHLHVVATRFRLLRQHGLRVSADVFDKFRDGTGSLSTNLSSDTRGLLSLYNAAHMAAPGEAALDEAISFTRHHLKTAVEAGKLRSPLGKQVSRALDIPLPRFTRCLEAMYYIAEYEQKETRDVTLLELARLNFNLVSSLHLRELKALSLWWRDIYDIVKLPYAWDRMVEGYFWTCGMFHEEEHSRARMIVAKTFGLLSILDDTYDVHATLEDCYRLNEAIQRWDESAVDVLPEYLHMFYIKMRSNFKEFVDILEPDEKYRMSYTKKNDYCYQEAKWARDNYNPSFKEHVQVSAVSSGLAMLWIAALMGMVDTAHKEAFEWAVGLPDVANASGEIGHLLNDMAAYKLGKNKNDMTSSVECYMKDYGVTGQEAVAAVAAMVESAWRTMNRACMEADRALAPAVKLLANMTKTLEIIYLRGRDANTFPGDLKGLVTDLFLKPTPPVQLSKT